MVTQKDLYGNWNIVIACQKRELGNWAGGDWGRELGSNLELRIELIKSEDYYIKVGEERKR